MREQQREHVWVMLESFGYPFCKVCGAVQRADGKNKPCKGPVKITLRTQSARYLLPIETEVVE